MPPHKIGPLRTTQPSPSGDDQKWQASLSTVAAVMIALFAAGCTNQPAGNDTSGSAGQGSSESRGTIRVVATVGMVADLVREVGGSYVEVQQLLGAGTDPHLYKVTRDDVQRIMQAEIVFYSGLMLEGKMIDTLVKVARSKPVYAVTESLDPALLLEPEEFAGHYDPHVWMDVAAWSACVETVRQALTDFDQAHASEYDANAQAYQQVLADLDAYGKKCLATVPTESRVLVTSHDAFNYFGRAYGLEVYGVQGISTESEAGLQQINQLVDLLVNRNVKAVFVESSVPQKNVEALASGAKSRGREVRIGGVLYSDAMGETGTYEGTYVGMLDHNITQVTRALGGEAPAKGLNGKLVQAP